MYDIMRSMLEENTKLAQENGKLKFLIECLLDEIDNGSVVSFVLIDRAKEALK